MGYQESDLPYDNMIEVVEKSKRTFKCGIESIYLGLRYVVGELTYEM